MALIQFDMALQAHIKVVVCVQIVCAIAWKNELRVLMSHSIPGEFFLAELIESQDDDHKTIVADVRSCDVRMD